MAGHHSQEVGHAVTDTSAAAVGAVSPPAAGTA